jgi:hypothetical protein
VKAYSGANLLESSKRKIRQSSITLEKLTPRETYLREVVVESEAGIVVHGIELELERPQASPFNYRLHGMKHHMCQISKLVSSF